MRYLLIILTVIAVAACAGAADSRTGAADSSTGWILDRAADDSPSLQRATLHQADVGGAFAGGSSAYADRDYSLAKPMILSALMPGLGEATMGYRRGYAMMALDIASWLGVKHYHDLGGEKRDAYIAYADEHWSLDRLAAAFGSDAIDYVGTFYYDVGDHEDLSLWVSAADDYREYYENLGKWDQFVFGWDDFTDPRAWVGLGATSADLKDDERVSANRLTYRSMRKDSNDQFDRRDQLIYLNMATRIFSMFQVAFLGGAFDGDGDDMAAGFDVGDHRVALIAEPRGLTTTRLGVAISY